VRCSAGVRRDVPRGTFGGDGVTASLVVRPLTTWDGPVTASRDGSPFSAGWQSTKELLLREVSALNDHPVIVVVEVDVHPDHFRLDGKLRAGAVYLSPRVAVSFPSRHGPLRYQCDQFTTSRAGAWQQNVRAVALGLEALRKVDRYGIGSSGKQYAGFAELSAPAPEGFTSHGDAARFLAEREQAGRTWTALLGNAGAIGQAYRAAAAKTHPDVGGDPAVFRRVTAARDLLIRGCH
jgi:hypothetical protein